MYVLFLCFVFVSLAKLPTAFSRPRKLMDGSGAEAVEVLSAKRSSVDCGQITNNTLLSPGYPDNYTNNIDCVYRISIPHGKAMNIYFAEFEVEHEYSCYFDYLKITNERNQTFGQYCGNQNGKNVVVTGNYAVLTFHSDYMYGGKYRLIFSDFSNSNGTQPPPSLYPTPGNATFPPWHSTSPPQGNSTYPPWATTSPPNGGCGYVQNNVLLSPGYPYTNYPNNMDCTYWIHIPHGKALRIVFDVFHMDDCGYDYLRITNDHNQTFGDFCGKDKSGEVVIVTGHYAVVKFYSDSSVTDIGYKLYIGNFTNGNFSTSAPYTTPYNNYTNPPWYTTAPPNGGCGSVQNDVLLSPGYPNRYPHNMDCTYSISIPYGKALRLDFDVFEVDDCGYDYLRITNEKNQTFGDFCGSKQGHVVVVTGYYAILKFYSDSSINDQGYKLFISYVSGNVSTSAPYTTYPPYTSHTGGPTPSYYPTMDPKSKLLHFIHILRVILTEMENVVNNEFPSANISARGYKERVNKALTDAHEVMNSGIRQKRDVRNALIIGQLEKKAAELIKKLDAKEAQFKRRALMKKNLAKRTAKKA